MMGEKIYTEIKQKVEKSNFFQPLLFVGSKSEILSSEIQKISQRLCMDFGVSIHSITTFSSDDKSYKVADIRDFIVQTSKKPSGRFQIFIIEDFEKANTAGQNAMLKFLEEPGEGNIVFLGVNNHQILLETILSRVIVRKIDEKKDFFCNNFYYDMLDEYLNGENINLLSYFFEDKKLEKEHYIDFLKTFLYYMKKNLVFPHLGDEVLESLYGIEKNNVLGKLEVDRLLLKISLG